MVACLQLAERPIQVYTYRTSALEDVWMPQALYLVVATTNSCVGRAASTISAPCALKIGYKKSEKPVFKVENVAFSFANLEEKWKIAKGQTESSLNVVSV